MKNKSRSAKVWTIPLLLAALIVLGLLSALLGTGYWQTISWFALAVPLITIGIKYYQTSTR